MLLAPHLRHNFFGWLIVIVTYADQGNAKWLAAGIARHPNNHYAWFFSYQFDAFRRVSTAAMSTSSLLKIFSDEPKTVAVVTPFVEIAAARLKH